LPHEEAFTVRPPSRKETGNPVVRLAASASTVAVSRPRPTASATARSPASRARTTAPRGGVNVLLGDRDRSRRDGRGTARAVDGDEYRSDDEARHEQRKHSEQDDLRRSPHAENGSREAAVRIAVPAGKSSGAPC
jgi:hypothetical protein